MWPNHNYPMTYDIFQNLLNEVDKGQIKGQLVSKCPFGVTICRLWAEIEAHKWRVLALLVNHITLGQLYSGRYHPPKLLEFAKSQIAEQN